MAYTRPQPPQALIDCDETITRNGKTLGIMAYAFRGTARYEVYDASMSLLTQGNAPTVPAALQYARQDAELALSDL